MTLSNRHYDPKVGHALYNEYLEQLIAAERFGYDGLCVNEHHQNAYGTMPSPDIMAAYLAAKTERIPIGIIGNALPLHSNPVRVAEEVAMLDVISGGRIISGFVRGTGMEYHSYGANPSYFRGKQPIDDLVFAITVDPAVRWQRVKAGECNLMSYPNPADLTAIKADQNVTVLQQEGLNVGYLAYNTLQPPFDKPEVRKALNMAVNKQAIIGASGRVSVNFTVDSSTLVIDFNRSGIDMPVKYSQLPPA